MRSRGARVSVMVVFGVVAVACSSGGESSTPTQSATATTDPAVAVTSTVEPTTPPEDTASGTDPTGDSAPDSTPDSATDDSATDPGTSAAADYDFSALQPIVAAFVDDRELNGAGVVVVQRDDGVIHEEYWGDIDADRISLIASSSKMISAGILLHLDDEGVLDIDAPVADVVEWGAANPEITPAQLISNSSGLVGLLPNPAYGPYICQYLAAGTLQECAEQIFTTSEDDAGVIAPDTAFRYGGAQWTVAGAVAEAASGMAFAELVETTFAEPCGLESLEFNNHFAQMGAGFDYPVEFDGDPSTLEPTQNPNPEGGAYITAPDYGALLLMHLRDGKCGDTQVLSPEALDRMHTDRIGPVYDGQASASGSGGAGTGYGMGWWVNRTTGRINDGGAYGTVPWLDLEDGYGVYLVIEADAGTGAELAELIGAPIEAAVTGR